MLEADRGNRVTDRGHPAGADAAANDNPCLPDASTDGNDYSAAQATPAPEGPGVPFRDGNAYARLRLALMGCEIPGG